MATPDVQKRWRMKTGSQGRKRIEIYLSNEVIERLDAIADAAGVSRAQALDRLIKSAKISGDKQDKTAQEAPPPRVETPPPPPADTSTGKRGKAKHRKLAEFNRDRGITRVIEMLREQFDAEYTAAEVRDLVEPRWWHAMLQAEAEMLRATGRTDREITRDWNKAGVPPIDGRGKWTQNKLLKLRGN